MKNNETYLEIIGGRSLHGRVCMHGAKNAVLPLIAAGILTKETVTIKDCPHISDVDVMIALIKSLGADVTRDGRNVSVRSRATHASVKDALCKDMRSSMFMLGALVATLKEVELDYPGGCRIGARPLDIHLDGLRRMGATIEYTDTGVKCAAKELHGANIVMKYPSVGATENLLMCATLAKGETTLVNCAREPEIVSLASCLRAMGARITGDGTSVMHISGVDELGGCEFTPIGDRIVAATLVCAANICGGEVEIDGVGRNMLGAVCDAVESKYCKISGDGNSMRISSFGKPKAVNVTTAPYPLFPTDVQPQIFACSLFSDGVSTIKETVFENRFAHAKEFIKLGADCKVESNVAYVQGARSKTKAIKLSACDMTASDLRGGAGLILAALGINGKSRVYGTEFIDRGYESVEDMFCSLGGNVIRKTVR